MYLNIFLNMFLEIDESAVYGFSKGSEKNPKEILYPSVKFSN